MRKDNIIQGAEFSASRRHMNRPGEQSESVLLRRIDGGDDEAFLALYRRFQGPVYRFALHMSGQEAIAEDVTQEVFMILIEKRSRFDSSRGALGAYLIGMARHLLLQRFERDQRLVPFPDGDPSGAPPASQQHSFAAVPPPDPVRGENIQRLRQAVLSLPPEYRETVVLCELEEMTYQEAAGILGCPVGTVRSRLHRARALLAEKLREFRRPERRASIAGSQAGP